MIERNLGNVERVIRLVLAVAFLAWAVTRPYMNAIEWFICIIALMFFVNGIFSRCYVWYVLDINTFRKKDCDPV